MRLLGAVLAGGQATRFGSDKALALLKGRPLILHAAAAIAPLAEAMVVCGRDGAALGLVGIPDWPSAGLGPLGGICGALKHCTTHGFDAALTIGCDMPSLPADLGKRLVAADGGCFVRQAPIVGCWPAGLFASLEGHLEAGGDGSVARWAVAVGCASLDGGGEIANFNYPGDLDSYAGCQ